jgi:hypothetical protein
MTEKGSGQSKTPGATSSALLIYPFGTSDLQRPDGPLQRGDNLADFVSTLKEAQPRVQADQLEWVQNGEVVARMPILSSTLLAIAEGGGGEVALQPILTKQEPPHHQDTAPLDGLLRSLDGLTVGGVKLSVRNPWYVEVPPHDYGQVRDAYGELFEEYKNAVARQFGRRYFQVATGTPAMSFAAGLFAADPELVFLYTPRDQPTTRMQLLTEERRRQTDELVGRLLERLDWWAAGVALLRPLNGYMPIDEVTEHNPKVEDVHRLVGLGLWHRRLYEAAANHFGQLKTTQPADLQLLRLCATLGGTWDVVWQQAALDNFNRMLVARAPRGLVEDLPGFIAALYAFNDACLNWAIASVDPRRNPQTDALCDQETEKKVQARFPAFRAQAGAGETDRLRLAWWRCERSADGDRLPDWWGAYRLLHFVLEEVVDPLRNALIHGGTSLRKDELERRWEERFPAAGVENVADLLTVLSARVLRVILGQGRFLWPVLELHDALARTDRSKEVEALFKAGSGQVKLVEGLVREAVERDKEKLEPAIGKIEQVCGGSGSAENVREQFSDGGFEALLEAAVHGLVDRRQEEGRTPHWVATLVGQALAEAGVDPFAELIERMPRNYPGWVRRWLDGEKELADLRSELDRLRGVRDEQGRPARGKGKGER